MGGSFVPHSTDVLILGAGPAGLSAARECAKAGSRVHVVERKSEVGSPVRTSGATWVGNMEREGIPSRLYHRVETIRVFSPAREASFKNTGAGICVLDVHGMLQYMARQAIGAGATISVGTHAVEPLTSRGRVVGARIQTPSGKLDTIEAAVTIDATGGASLLAKRMRLFRGFRRWGQGLEYDLYAPGWPAGEFVLLMGSQIAPTGYAWIFPWDEGRVRVGAGITIPDGRGADLYRCLERLIWDDRRFAPYFKGASQIEIHKGFIPNELFPVDPFGDGFLIIGDAASQASQLAGEGIRFAMEMGRIAGKVCAAAVKKGDVSRRCLGRAHAEWRRLHRGNFLIAHELNLRMAAFNDAQWDKAVEYLGRLSSTQFLSFLKTEFSLGLFMGIIAKNPALAGKNMVKMLLKQLRTTGE